MIRRVIRANKKEKKRCLGIGMGGDMVKVMFLDKVADSVNADEKW